MVKRDESHAGNCYFEMPLTKKQQKGYRHGTAEDQQRFTQRQAFAMGRQVENRGIHGERFGCAGYSVAPGAIQEDDRTGGFGLKTSNQYHPIV